MSRFLNLYCVFAAIVLAVLNTVHSPVEKSRVAAEAFRRVAVGADEDESPGTRKEYLALVAAFTENEDAVAFEFDSSLTIAAVAHWYSISAQLSDRINIQDFRELRASLVAGFVGRIEGRLNTRAPDFWKESLSSFQFYLEADDEEMPYRVGSTTTDVELRERDEEEYSLAGPMTAGVTPYARRLGLTLEDAKLFFHAKKNEMASPDISDIRLDAEQAKNDDRVLLLYSVDTSPVYYLRHQNAGTEAKRKVYHNYAMTRQFNLLDISVSGDKVVVWGVTPASCFFTVHDAGDLSLLDSFYTQF